MSFFKRIATRETVGAFARPALRSDSPFAALDQRRNPERAAAEAELWAPSELEAEATGVDEGAPDVTSTGVGIFERIAGRLGTETGVDAETQAVDPTARSESPLVDVDLYLAKDAADDASTSDAETSTGTSSPTEKASAHPVPAPPEGFRAPERALPQAAPHDASAVIEPSARPQVPAHPEPLGPKSPVVAEPARARDFEPRRDVERSETTFERDTRMLLVPPAAPHEGRQPPSKDATEAGPRISPVEAKPRAIPTEKIRPSTPPVKPSSEAPSARRAAVAATPAALEAGVSPSLQQALARVDAWMREGPSRPAAETARRTEVRLSIGRIEVEVVNPLAPSFPTARRSPRQPWTEPASHAAAALAFERPRFGLRQR